MTKTIAWLSDGFNLMTGYSSQSLNITNILSDDGHNVHYLNHTSPGASLKGARLMDGTEVKATQHFNGMQPYYQDILEHKLRELNADVFGTLLDTFMLYPSILSKDFAPTRSQIFYFPSDGGGFPVNCENVLRKYSHPIAMSKYAQRQVKENYGIDTGYIAHGVNTELFRRLPDEERAILRAKWGLTNKYVVGVVARNQPRKMLDRTLEAFSLVAKQNPNAVLLAHWDPYDPASPFDSYKMINDLRLQNRVVFTGTRYYKGLDYKQMQEIYNLMDVFFLGTSGEGFGIPTIEAMSCEVPVLATDYTTTEELVTDHKAGEAVNLGDEVLGSWHVKRAIVSIKDSAERMIRLSQDENLRKEYGKNGRRACLNEYSWEIIGNQWKELIRKI